MSCGLGLMTRPAGPLRGSTGTPVLPRTIFCKQGDWRVADRREAQREALYKAVYDTDYWKTKIAPRVPDCLDRDKMVITRIVPTPKSTVA